MSQAKSAMVSDPVFQADVQAPEGDAVIVVHGYGVPRVITTLLARRLGRLGYRSWNLAYPSLLPSVEEAASHLRRKIRDMAAEPDVKRIHLVAHSMGGILIRCALRSGDLSHHIGRIVMLGPPNAGSRVATFLQPALGWLSRPLQELAHTPGSFVNKLPTSLPGLEVGVLAATSDALVHHQSTHLEAETDHLTLTSTHTTIVFRKDATYQVAHFLKYGRFARAAARAEVVKE